MSEIVFNSSAGRIEARYHPSKQDKANVALILSGNPQSQFNMNDKITYTLFHAFATQGFSVMRFNYRGVGFSQGEFENGEGELADAAAAIDVLSDYNNDINQFWIAGYDFGAWIAMQLIMRRPEIKNFVSIMPPITNYDFSFLSPCPSSGMIISCDDMMPVYEEKLKKHIKNLEAQKTISITKKIIEATNPKFENQLKKLHQAVSMYIVQRLRGLK
jgi:hypothetical protein